MATLNIMVIGLGYFGESIAMELASLGHQVVGIDTDADVIHRTSQFLDSAFEMDAHQPGSAALNRCNEF